MSSSVCQGREFPLLLGRSRVYQQVTKFWLAVNSLATTPAVGENLGSAAKATFPGHIEHATHRSPCTCHSNVDTVRERCRCMPATRAKFTIERLTNNKV